MPAQRGTTGSSSRVTLRYDCELGLTFTRQDSHADDGPLYLVPETEAVGHGAEGQVSLRVLGAELQRGPSSHGRMETFAVVCWVFANGPSLQVGRTATDLEGDVQPRWEHACRNQPYAGRGQGDRVEVRVYEDVGATSSLRGQAFADVDDLLGWGKSARSGTVGAAGAGAPQRLPLRLAEEEAGFVEVQARLVFQEANGAPSLTRVDSSLFESPVARIGVSGGTAPFFRLRLREASPGRSCCYYIGKDLSHAEDEVLFYEHARAALPKQPRGGGLGPILSFMFEYAGIVTCNVAEEELKDQRKDLLVLRNLHDGCVTLRLLDLKIGQKTASAGWQGKSKSASMRQALVDGVTNSTCEGFRLEGFDGAPESLKTMNPLMDFGGGSDKAMKKAFRIMLQRMTGAEVMMHFLDVHQTPADPGGDALERLRAPLEVAELVLRDTVRRLALLAVSCRHVPVPQKWIGSSVALAFDCGQLPTRSEPESKILETVKVHIFDWGRSELNTPENHSRLSAKEQQNRGKFWGFYTGGIDRLAWEAARAYWHRFSNTEGWREACITVLDFDSHSENDFIGRVRLWPAEEPEEHTELLRDARGGEVKASRSSPSATLTYTSEYRKYPAGSRLHGAWRIGIVRAEHLPRCNWACGTTDAFVELTAVSKSGSQRFRQVTSVKPNNVNPVWQETLELPLAAQALLLESQLDAASPRLGSGPMADMLPCEEAILSSLDLPATLEGPDNVSGFEEWLSRLDQAVSSPALPSTPRAPLERRLVCGQTVSLIERGSLPTRLLACTGSTISCMLAFWLIALASLPSRLGKDLITPIVCFFQLFFAASALLFELPLTWVVRRRRLDRFQDCLIAHVGCLAKAFGRGLLYELLGVLWLGVYLLNRCTRQFVLFLGLYQCLVGCLYYGIHSGKLTTRIVRKAHQALPR